jgi:uncharacterized protein YndB with AHSA1/START domain
MKAMFVLGFVIVAASVLPADRSVKKSVVVDAPVAEVWKAWTTPEGIATFFSPNANVDLRPGGRYEILFSKLMPAGLRGAEGCQVLSYIPERMLSFSWNAPPNLPVMRLHKTFVVLEFTPVEEGKTRVDLTNGGYGEGADWDKAYAYFDSAWTWVTNSLQKRFKDGPMKWPAQTAPTADELRGLPLPEATFKEMSRFVGGKWVGEVKGPEGPLAVEFVYDWHPDKKGIRGKGVIGKGSKNPVYIDSSFGVDPLTGAIYYLDSHNSGTVYYGHLTVEDEDLVFVFGPAGGKMDQFTSRGRFRDKDTYDNKIRQADGKEIVGFTLKRQR